MADFHILNTWIKNGEGPRLDFKTTITSRPKIARNLVAFANSRGGKLVVGVEDKGFLVGVDFEGEKYELEKTCQQYCSPQISIQRFSQLQSNGKIALVAEIAESLNKPHYAIDKNGNKKLYVRLNDSCITPPESIKTMLLNGDLNGLQRTYDYELAKRNLIKHLKNNETINVQDWAKIRNIKTESAQRFLVDILLEGVINLVRKNELVFELAWDALPKGSSF